VAIAKKRWSKKKGKLKVLEAKVEQQEISSLHKDLDATWASLEDALEEASQLNVVQEEFALAKETIRSLQSEVDELRCSQERMKALVDVVEPMGGLKKIDNKELCIAAISSLLVTFLGIIMKSTHPKTRLRAVCEALFDNILFGVEATKVALNKISQSKVLEVHRKIFLPWKVLCAIDLSIGGCLNYSGVDALWSVEGIALFSEHRMN